MVTRPVPGEMEESGKLRAILTEAARNVGRPLASDEVERLVNHHRTLIRWGRRMNLTGLRRLDEIVRRHFLEPIEASSLIERAGTLLDLGSGNGFPAIPLAVLRPGLELILVESSQRKSEFLWCVLRDLGMRSSRVETRRVRRRDDLRDLLPVDYLTFRAIRGRDLLSGPGGAILRPGGRLLAFVSHDESASLRLDPPPGLRWTMERKLSASEHATVAVLEREAGA